MCAAEKETVTFGVPRSAWRLQAQRIRGFVGAELQRAVRCARDFRERNGLQVLLDTRTAVGEADVCPTSAAWREFLDRGFSSWSSESKDADSADGSAPASKRADAVLHDGGVAYEGTRMSSISKPGSTTRSDAKVDLFSLTVNGDSVMMVTSAAGHQYLRFLRFYNNDGRGSRAMVPWRRFLPART